MTTACSRHGIVDVAADAPCPVCQQLTYDLDDRAARDVVRDHRRIALALRTRVAGVGLFAAVTTVVALGPVEVTLFGLPVLAIFAGALAASFGARRLATLLEPDARRRQLDVALAARL
jgi:hypothetical protein